MYRMFDDVQVHCDLGEKFRVYLIKQRKLESVAILDTAFEGIALCVACLMMSSYIVISERSFECIDCIRQRKLRSVAILAQGIFLAQGGYVERGI